MSYANRGMAFEQLIDYTNQMYERKGIALINKRPTPVKILGHNGHGGINGFVEKPSTVDYDGVYRGRSIAFEAKSTKEMSRFDLKNVQDHQLKYLDKVHRHGGIAFLLVEFIKQQSVYLMSFETLESYWHKAQQGGRKSIRIEDFDIYAYKVEQGRVPLDYLRVVDQIFLEVSA